MNKKILYKLLLIFALLACILLISNTKSFAADTFTHTSDVYNLSYVENSNSKLQAIYDIIDNNQDYFAFTSSELPEYQVIVKSNTETEGVYTYQFISFSIPFYTLSTQTNDNKLYFKYVFSSSPYTYYKYSFSVTDYGFYTGSTGDSIYEDSGAKTSYTGYSYSYGYEIVNSNYDILNENNEVVFQQPPQVQEQVTTLAPIVEEVETEKTLMEVVGILPLIIVVVVSLVGLRKALKMLLAVLHRA